MTMANVLNVFAPIALTIFVLGIALKLGRWAMALATKRKPRGVSRIPGAAPPLGAFAALKAVLVDPVTRFYVKGNAMWARGYTLYHIAIVTIVAAYASATLIVFGHILLGQPIPDMAAQLSESHNYQPANVLAIVFGNAEAPAATFLYGSFASALVAISWAFLVLAAAGNTQLLLTILMRRNGAVVSDLDTAARNFRTRGHLTWDRLAVTLLVFAIIWTELLSRLNVVPGILDVHSLFGLLMFALFPFTYLFHMAYNVLAVAYAARRRMARTIA